MKNLLLIISLLVALPLYAQNGSISANKSTVSFTITNAGLDVDGKFTNITGSIVFDKNSLSNSKFTATIKVESIDTEIEMRDNHLREEDYFNIAEYPTMKFESTKITNNNGSFNVSGNLTIKDVTKTISFPFTVNNNTLNGSFVIDRRDYNVGGNSWIMGDDVTVNLKIATD